MNDKTNTALPNPTALTDICIRDAGNNEVITSELHLTEGKDRLECLATIVELLQEGKTVILNPVRK